VILSFIAVGILLIKTVKMKDLRMAFEGLRKNPVFVENFSCVEDVFNGFVTSEEQEQGVEILYAAYHRPDWEGYATVYFYNAISGKYYEVHGSHCSCYGLEGQWVPEELSLEGLQYILDNGNSHEYDDFREILGS